MLLDAIEHAEYGAVLSHIHDAARRDVVAISAALDEFGMADMATLVTQAKARMQFLDKLEALARNVETREAEMHKAIERDLWILGITCTFFRSNQTLKRTVEDALGRKYEGAKAFERPDLLLSEDLNGSCLLIEFKRPSHALNHEDYVQAISYRHELAKYMSKPIEVLLMGGAGPRTFQCHNERRGSTHSPLPTLFLRHDEQSNGSSWWIADAAWIYVQKNRMVKNFAAMQY